MSRLTNIEIAGTSYPLNFSTRAAKEISARYGGLENIDKAFSGKAADAMMDEVVWLLSLLIEQGVAYKRIVDGEEIKGITSEDLEVVLGIADLAGLKDKILDSMTAGASRTVETESDPKNGKPTQGN